MKSRLCQLALMCCWSLTKSLREERLSRSGCSYQKRKLIASQVRRVESASS